MVEQQHKLDTHVKNDCVKQSWICIQHIITDYDGILRSKECRKYFAALEWSQTFSAPYAHWQNPAENYMKKTKDIGLSLLNNAGLPNVCQELCFAHATYLIGLHLPRNRHDEAHEGKTPREIVTGRKTHFNAIQGKVIGMICWCHEPIDVRSTATAPKARQGFWGGFDQESACQLVYFPATNQLLARATVSGDASTFYGDMYGAMSNIRTKIMHQARNHSEADWRNMMEQIRRSDQLQKEHRRAHRDVLRQCEAGTEAYTKAITTGRLLDQSAMKMLEVYEAIEERATASRREDRLRLQALHSLPASNAAPGSTAGGADCMDDSQLEEHERSTRPRRVRKQVQSDSWKNAEWNGLKGSFSTMKCSWHHTEPEEPYVFSTVPVSIKQKSVRYREQSNPRQTTFIDSEGETKQTFDHVGSFDGSVAKEEQARQRAERKRSDEMRRRGGGKKQRRKRLLREHFEQGRFRPGRRGEQMRRQWAERKEAEPGGQQKSGSSAGGAERHDAMDVDGPPQPSTTSTTTGEAAGEMDTSAGGAASPRTSLHGHTTRPTRYCRHKARVGEAAEKGESWYRDGYRSNPRDLDIDAGYSPMPARKAPEEEESKAAEPDAEAQGHADHGEHLDFNLGVQAQAGAQEHFDLSIPCMSYSTCWRRAILRTS